MLFAACSSLEPHKQTRIKCHPNKVQIIVIIVLQINLERNCADYKMCVQSALAISGTESVWTTLCTCTKCLHKKCQDYNTCTKCQGYILATSHVQSGRSMHDV